MIYFDNSATTAVAPLVLDAYVKTSQRIMGNPSSLHDLGGQAARLLGQARRQLANSLQIKEEELFFTSSGTEGNNWVIKGTALAKREFGKHLLISAIEHPSVTETAAALRDLGFEVEMLPVNSQGVVVAEDLAARLRKDTILVSVMAVNNEIGTLQPIAEIAEVLAAYPTIHFHVDGVQALGKVPLTEWWVPRVDFITFSAHKYHGPKGMGFVYSKFGRRIAPLLNGGGQEFGQRSSTENVPGIVATAKAVRLLLEDSEKKQQHILRLRSYLAGALAEFEKVTVFSHNAAIYAPHILCFALKGVRGEVLVHALEEKQIYVSTTSACSSKKRMAAGTLRAMNVPEEVATSAVRISLDEHNTLAETEQFMVIFKQLYDKFSKINS